MVTRKAYNPSVIYHNFRHACDVLQAVFHFLVSNGIIPPLLGEGTGPKVVSCALASLIRPVHALTLLIAAIGHDVGHPGVNNVFLVKVKAAVAQVYNDHSVLESYHCAASSQILRRFWPAAFVDVAMRKMMISTILATDMTLHGQYTARLDELRKKYTQGGKSIEGEDDKTLEEHRELLCCLIIKCADICNVVRLFCSLGFVQILARELANARNIRHEDSILQEVGLCLLPKNLPTKVLLRSMLKSPAACLVELPIRPISRIWPNVRLGLWAYLHMAFSQRSPMCYQGCSSQWII